MTCSLSYAGPKFNVNIWMLTLEFLKRPGGYNWTLGECFQGKENSRTHLMGKIGNWVDLR